MGLASEFKEFAMRGNVIDLAIGVVIGAAFGRIVNSLVTDILTPAILTPALKAAHITDLKALKIPGTGIMWGSFVSEIISFAIVAFALFLIVKAINAAKKKEKAAPVGDSGPTTQEKLLMEIRDALKK